MKKIALILTLAACVSFAACKNSGKTNATTDGDAAAATTEQTAYELPKLLTDAEQHLGEQVTVVGYVTHTCKHSGKRCFITDEGKEVSMRVEARGEIGGFNRELVGSKVEISGVLKEQRLSQEYIDEMEKKVEAEAESGESDAEHCESEQNSINQMREWMAANGKDYYAIYYMDGETYKVLD